MDGEVVHYKYYVVERISSPKFLQEDLELGHVDGPWEGHDQLDSYISRDSPNNSNNLVVDSPKVQLSVASEPGPIVRWYSPPSNHHLVQLHYPKAL